MGLLLLILCVQGFIPSARLVHLCDSALKTRSAEDGVPGYMLRPRFVCFVYFVVNSPAVPPYFTLSRSPGT